MTNIAGLLPNLTPQQPPASTTARNGFNPGGSAKNGDAKGFEAVLSTVGQTGPSEDQNAAAPVRTTIDRMAGGTANGDGTATAGELEPGLIGVPAKTAAGTLGVAAAVNVALPSSSSTATGFTQLPTIAGAQTGLPALSSQTESNPGTTPTEAASLTAQADGQAPAVSVTSLLNVKGVGPKTGAAADATSRVVSAAGATDSAPTQPKLASDLMADLEHAATSGTAGSAQTSSEAKTQTADTSNSADNNGSPANATGTDTTFVNATFAASLASAQVVSVPPAQTAPGSTPGKPTKATGAESSPSKSASAPKAPSAGTNAASTDAASSASTSTVQSLATAAVIVPAPVVPDTAGSQNGSSAQGNRPASGSQLNAPQKSALMQTPSQPNSPTAAPSMPSDSSLMTDASDTTTVTSPIKVGVVSAATHFAPVAHLSPVQQIADAVITNLQAPGQDPAAASDVGGSSEVAATSAALPTGLSVEQSAGPVKVLNLLLEPPTLGSVTVNLSLSDGQLSLQLAASQPGTMTLIEKDKNSLSDQLRDSGYSIGSVGVTLTPDGSNVANDGSATQNQGGQSASQSGQAMSNGGSSNGNGSSQNGANSGSPWPLAQTADLGAPSASSAATSAGDLYI